MKGRLLKITDESFAEISPIFSITATPVPTPMSENTDESNLLTKQKKYFVE